mmetsp:Transcript_15726/g.17564  ORF Transcript_15726/g.17564 Transcript_15726/m.17564 type:complete len:202 (+) Transcript_15726:256-861(+)
MHLNLFHIASFRHTWHLVNFSHVIQNRWRMSNSTRIGFEVNNVYVIEPQQGCEQTNISFRKSITSNVPLFFQNFINTIKSFCQLCDSNIVCFLILSQSTSVYTIIEARINKIVHFINRISHFLGISVQLRILCKIIKLRAKHTNNICRFIADDSFQLFIPKDWHGILPFCVIGCLVDISKKLGTNLVVCLIIGITSREWST